MSFPRFNSEAKLREVFVDCLRVVIGISPLYEGERVRELWAEPVQDPEPDDEPCYTLSEAFEPPEHHEERAA